MNQDQRKFLIERVNKTFNHQKQEIEREYEREKPLSTINMVMDLQIC